MSDTLVDRDQPERYDDRHEPHRRRRARTRGGAVDRDREPPPERPRRQERRCALHVRRSRRRDERRVDEGVLLADRGRLPARAARSPKRFGGPTIRRTGDARRCSQVSASFPTRCARSSNAVPRSPPPRTATRRTGARGRSSATASTASPPQELRIKLSELCYKSIACDVTEDKKHIDLSAEPLILVCAAGLRGSNADDVGKELAIYRAHKAAPIVIATDGETGCTRGDRDDPPCPWCIPTLAFVLVGDGGPPVRLRSRARHRRDRACRCARRARAIETRRRRRSSTPTSS